MEPRIIKRTIKWSRWEQDVERLGLLAYTGNAGGHRLELVIEEGAGALTGGTATAYFLTGSGEPVKTPVAAQIAGNAVRVTFPAQAYAAGQASVIVMAQAGGASIPVYAASYIVRSMEADIVLDPQDVVPDLEQLLAQLADTREAAQDAKTATAAANKATASANTAASNANTKASAANTAATAANKAATNANTKADLANEAATAANEAAANANAKAEAISEAEAAANEAAANANEKAGLADTAAANANAKASAADTAAANANAKASAANTAAANANAKASAANTAATAANEAAANADAKADEAATAAAAANEAAANADAKAEAISEAEAAANEAAANADAKAEAISEAEAAANKAAASIEGMTVSARTLAANSEAEAVIRDGETGKHIELGIPAGAMPDLTFTAKTGEPDTDVVIDQSGTPENVHVNLTIPRGKPGTGNVSSVCGVGPGSGGDVDLRLEDIAGRSRTGEIVTMRGGAGVPMHVISHIDVEQEGEVIVSEGNGNPAVMTNVQEGKMTAKVKVYGGIEQTGTPSPDSAANIRAAGEGERLDIAMTGRNLMSRNTLSFNGALAHDIRLEPGTYTLSLYVTSDAQDGENASISYTMGGETYIKQIPRKKRTSVVLRPEQPITKLIFSGTSTPIGQASVRTTISQIMLNVGETALPYEAYRGTTFSAEVNGGLAGIPVESNGNYVAANGQMWLSDVLEDGRVKRYVKKIVFDGTEKWGAAPYSTTENEFQISFVDHNTYYGLNESDSGRTQFVEAISDRFVYQKTERIPEVGKFRAVLNESGVLYMVFNIDTALVALDDLEAWKAWLAGNPVTVYIAEDGPTETCTMDATPMPVGPETCVCTTKPVAGIEATAVGVCPFIGKTDVALEVAGVNLIPWAYAGNSGTGAGVTAAICAEGAVLSGTPEAADAVIMQAARRLRPGAYAVRGGSEQSAYTRAKTADGTFQETAFTLLQAADVEMALMTGSGTEALDGQTAAPMLTAAEQDGGAFEPYMGRTYAQALGRTVYGGDYDWLTGELTIRTGHIASYAGEALPGRWWCDRAVYVPGETPPEGSEVVYELEESETVKLGETVTAQTLEGVTNVYSSTGRTTVCGRVVPVSVNGRMAGADGKIVVRPQDIPGLEEYVRALIAGGTA